MRSTWSRITAPAAVLAGVLAVLTATLLAAPASAEFYRITDPQDAKPSLTDIVGLEANHGADNVLVKVRFAELLRSSSAGVAVFFDTDREHKGPEFVLNSGLGDATDYILTAADGWHGSDQMINCDYSARPKWGRDVFRVVVSRGCLDDPALVRVAAKMLDQVDGDTPVVDWAPKRHRWSLPLASGTPV